MNENLSISSRMITFFISGITFAYLLNKIKSSFKAKNRERNKLSMSEIEILKEQLKRNNEFFSDEGMRNLKDKFIIVVGIGGVGRYNII